MSIRPRTHSPPNLQDKMSSCVLLSALFTIHLAVGEILTDERDEVQRICAGMEFRLPVHSTFSTVTFTQKNDGPKQILLDNTNVRDPRFKFTRDKVLVLKDVTHSDQGLYAVKIFTGFTYQTVHLVVTACLKSYHRNYGDNFEHNIPENGALLVFSPRGAPSEAVPIVLWNRTDPETSSGGRGRLLPGRRVWVAERVTQVDQGNYTVKDSQGRALSRIALTVRGHSSKATRSTNESVNLPLFLPVHRANLVFTPTLQPGESSLGPSDPKPPLEPVQLIREGQITNNDMRYRGLLSLGRNNTVDEVVISRLTSSHNGVYEIRDGDGNLVSSTSLDVIPPAKWAKFQALLKSISVPSGMFVSLVGFILFMKNYPGCSLSRIIACFRGGTPPANPPRVNIQDYSQPDPEPSRYYGQIQQPGTPRKWTPRASPTHSGYTPVTIGTPRVENLGIRRSSAQHSPIRNSPAERGTVNEEETNISCSVPGASDCLHSSEDCVQFQIKKNGEKERCSKSQDFFSTLPLDRDTSESCSVYTSEKLNVI